MTSYERLTLYLAEAKETCRHTECGKCQYNKYGQNCSIRRFAKYLIDNGVIVPPCKVGDTVYYVQNDKILETQVINMYMRFDLFDELNNKNVEE